MLHSSLIGTAVHVSKAWNYHITLSTVEMLQLGTSVEPIRKDQLMTVSTLASHCCRFPFSFFIGGFLLPWQACSFTFLQVSSPPHCSPPFCPTIFCSPQGSLCSPALLEIVMSKLPLSAAVVCMRQEHQVGPEVLHGGQRECSKADTSFYNCSGNGVQNALHQILLVKKAPLLASPYKPSCQRSSHPRSGRHR